jgi:hypothetical protein
MAAPAEEIYAEKKNGGKKSSFFFFFLLFLRFFYSAKGRLPLIGCRLTFFRCHDQSGVAVAAPVSSEKGRGEVSVATSRRPIIISWQRSSPISCQNEASR